MFKYTEQLYLTRLQHVCRFLCCFLLGLQTRGGVWVDNADHAIIDTRSGSRTIEKDRIGIIYLKGPGRGVVEDSVNRSETGEEADLINLYELERDTWIVVRGAHNAVSLGIKPKLDDIIDFRLDHIWRKSMPTL